MLSSIPTDTVASIATFVENQRTTIGNTDDTSNDNDGEGQKLVFRIYTHARTRTRTQTKYTIEYSLFDIIL